MRTKKTLLSRWTHQWKPCPRAASVSGDREKDKANGLKLFQTLGDTLWQLPLNVLSQMKSDWGPYLDFIAPCYCVWALSWEVNVNRVFILFLESYIFDWHYFTVPAVSVGRKRKMLPWVIRQTRSRLQILKPRPLLANSHLPYKGPHLEVYEYIWVLIS